MLDSYADFLMSVLLNININHNMGFFSRIKSYVLIHVIKHDIDPISNVNYRRKIGPVSDNDS